MDLLNLVANIERSAAVARGELTTVQAHMRSTSDWIDDYLRDHPVDPKPENPHGWSGEYQTPILWALAAAFAVFWACSYVSMGWLAFVLCSLCGVLWLLVAVARHNPAEKAEIEAQRLAEAAAIAQRCDSQNAAWIKGDVEWGMYGRSR